MDDGFKQGLIVASVFWSMLGFVTLVATYNHGIDEGKARTKRMECNTRGGIAVVDTYGDVQCVTKRVWP